MPAALIWPLPACHGVQKAIHAPAGTGAEDTVQRQVGAQELRAERRAALVHGDVRRREAEHELRRPERLRGAAGRDHVRGQVDRLSRRLEHEQ